MSEIRRGALLSYATILIVNLSGLLLTPAIIRGLGNAEYGLYMLIGSMAAYLGVLDFGLNNAVTRFVAQCAARVDRSQESRFLGAALVVNAIAITAILALGALLYRQLSALFGATLTPEALAQARLMLLLLVANVAVTVTGSLFTAISAGHERFTFTKSVNIVRYLLRIALVLLLLAADRGAVALVALDLALSASVLVANALYARRMLGARFAWYPLDQALVREVFAFSAWVFLFAIIGQFQWQTGQVVIGATQGTEQVAVYAVGILLGTYYGAFASAITALFMPRATRLAETKADAARLNLELVKIGRIALLVLLLILGGFACFGREFILLWAGADYAAAWTVAMIIMLVYTVPLSQSFANQLLEAKGLFAFKAKVYLAAMPAGVMLGYLLMQGAGVAGMALGIAAGWVLALLVMNVYYHRTLGLDIPGFFKEMARGLLPVFAVCLVLGLMLNRLPGAGWSILIVRSALFTVVYAALVYRLGMNTVERHEVRHLLRRLKWTHA
jgi:O-antigen/teichoic acid export membrane protein